LKRDIHEASLHHQADENIPTPGSGSIKSDLHFQGSVLRSLLLSRAASFGETSMLPGVNWAACLTTDEKTLPSPNAQAFSPVV